MPNAVLKAAAACTTAGLIASAGRTPPSLLNPSSSGPLSCPCHTDEIALTYDDGPNAAATPWLLEVLARHNVRATFFVSATSSGRAHKSSAKLLRLAISSATTAQLILGLPSNPRRASTKSYPLATRLSKILLAYLSVSSVHPTERRPFVLRIARELGLLPVQWNNIAGDWKSITPEAILSTLNRGIHLNQRRNRASNIVLHDSSHLAICAPRVATVEATDRFLGQYKPSGTKFVTLETWA